MVSTVHPELQAVLDATLSNHLTFLTTSLDPPARQTGDRIIISWDTAMSSKELSSYSACVVLQIKGETAYVLDVVRERLEYPDLKRKVIALHRNWRNACTCPFRKSYPDVLMMEPGQDRNGDNGARPLDGST